MSDLGHQPRWRQIQLELERDISAGLLAIGEKLASEEELAHRFLAHRHTVRRALARLQEKGVLRAEQGRGTYVQEPVLSHKHGAQSRVTATAARHGAVATRRMLEAKQVEASRSVASALRMRSGSPVLRVETLRTIGALPLSLTVHYFPLPRFEGIDGILSENGSITSAYEHFGVTAFVHAEARVTAEPARRRDALLLEQPASKPVLCVSNLSLDQAGVPIQLADSRYASGRFELKIDHLSKL